MYCDFNSGIEKKMSDIVGDDVGGRGRKCGTGGKRAVEGTEHQWGIIRVPYMIL